MMKRVDGRKLDELRQVEITRNFLQSPEGSVLIKMGNTKVICTSSIEEKLPSFIRSSSENHGWVTAEYSMLPRSTPNRMIRERISGGIKGRSHEIQRFIGRSLRGVVDLYAIPGKSVFIDCDVIQADGGTRTAAITGGFIALYDGFQKIMEQGKIKEFPIKNFLAAVSCGIVNETPMLDLCFDEDSRADVDINVVMNDKSEFIEIQGTAEGKGFSEIQLQEMLALAKKGIEELISLQKELIFGDLLK